MIASLDYRRNQADNLVVFRWSDRQPTTSLTLAPANLGEQRGAEISTRQKRCAQTVRVSIIMMAACHPGRIRQEK